MKKRVSEKNEDSPPRSLTRDNQRYATTTPNLLLGRTHSPSHFRLNLSLTPQIANPNRHSLSCPSQHQTSFGPAEVRGTRFSLRARGLRIAAASGSSCRCMSPTVSLIRVKV